MTVAGVMGNSDEICPNVMKLWWVKPRRTDLLIC